MTSYRDKVQSLQTAINDFQAAQLEACKHAFPVGSEVTFRKGRGPITAIIDHWYKHSSGPEATVLNVKTGARHTVSARSLVGLAL